MKPPFPALVSEWHNVPYPAIDPTSPALSHAGQTVVVTGSGSGIGQATSLAYAAAGASRLVLIGRRENKLNETKAKIKAQSPACEVETYSASAIKANELKEVAAKVKGWDVLVLSAGRATTPQRIEDADPDEWWDVVEVWSFLAPPQHQRSHLQTSLLLTLTDQHAWLLRHPARFPPLSQIRSPRRRRLRRYRQPACRLPALPGGKCICHQQARADPPARARGGRVPRCVCRGDSPWGRGDGSVAGGGDGESGCGGTSAGRWLVLWRGRTDRGGDDGADFFS